LPKEDIVNNFLANIGSILIMAMGIIFLYIAVFQYFQSRNMEEWQVTNGKILSTRIQQTRALYNPIVEYSYIVQNVKYQGWLISINGKVTNKIQVAREWIAPYTQGKEVVVHYNPKNPKMAVLETSFSVRVMMIEILFGLFLLSLSWLSAAH